MNIRIFTMWLCCLSGVAAYAADARVDDKQLRSDAQELLTEWMDTFLDYQCTMPDPSLHGGVLCPSCARVHGRIGDAVLPLMYLADRTGDEKYLRGAERLMGWMENVHRPDGSWMNDVHVSDWNGTTVFASIALYEALKHHGHLLSDSVRGHWMAQLEQAGDFMMNNPFIYSRKREGMRNMNVNYSASATYALYATGELCNRPDFQVKAREIAGDLKAYFTQNDCFLFGEGPNIWTETPNGCRPVDLLYNVEESLPNMAHYAVMAGDDELLALVDRSMRTHLEFMLPDGAWDNSWGTRSFKWTYWGGRTSDGFMGGYYLMARNNPMYAEAIRRNVDLLKEATHDGLLYGGMHYREAGMAPCIHHTFGHAKALTSFLEQPGCDMQNPGMLPRDEEYGVKHFRDIRTWLVSHGPWRATLTGYDAEYKVKGTHPMGGAMSVLWHEEAGPVFAATMNKYTMIESPNMQSSPRKYLANGTPRVELVNGGTAYTNLDDLHTDIACEPGQGKSRFTVNTHLVDVNQKSPTGTELPVSMVYTYSPKGVDIEVQSCSDSAYLMLPVICSPADEVVMADGKSVSVKKKSGVIRVRCDKGNVSMEPTDEDGRIFNPVPGFSFIPLKISREKGDNVMRVSIIFDNY